MHRSSGFAVCLAACLASPGSADFVSLVAREVDVVAEYTAVGYAPGPLTTDLDTINVYHLYAQFSAPTDMVLAVQNASMTTDTSFVDYDGIGANPEGIPTTGGNFINDFGEMIIDSFVTINDLANPRGVSLSVVGLPYPDFVDGSDTFISDIDSNYHVTPPTGVGLGTPTGTGLWEVLVAQIIVADPDGSGPEVGHLAGTLQLLTRDDFFWADIVPAPGTLALLGLCGVCTRRRRRA